MPPYHLEMLPIEVNKLPFQSSLQEGLLAGISPIQFLTTAQTKLTLIQKQVESLSPSLSFEQLETVYIKNRRNLTILQKEMAWIMQAYEKKAIDPQDISFLSDLSSQEKEIEARLVHWQKFLAKQYRTLPCGIKEMLNTAILEIERKSLSVLEMYALSNPKIRGEQENRMRNELLQFSQNYSKKIDPLLSFLAVHWEEWHTKRLEEGRGLLIKETYDPLLSLLICPNGTCYPLFATIGNLLGAGTYKMVLRAISIPEGKLRAIIRGSVFTTPSLENGGEDPSWFRHMWTEYNRLQPLKKKRGLIHLYNALPFFTPTGKEIFLVEDYYWKGSLEDYFHRTLYNPLCLPEAKLSQAQIEQIAEDLLEGLCTLHAEGIVHNDIKPDNILLSERKGSIEAVLADFHLATYTKDASDFHLRTVSRATWSPPEYAQMLLSQHPTTNLSEVFSFNIDIWALGLVFLMLFANEPPPWLIDRFRSTLEQGAPLPTLKQHEIDAPMFHQVANLPANWLPQAAQNSPFSPLLRAMLSIDPKKRVSAKGALALFQSCRKES